MIVIVGSKALWPTPGLASTILSIIISTDEPIGIRAYREANAPCSMIEEMADRIATRIERPLHHYPAGAAGSNTAFKRDNLMASDATHVYAFFAPGQEMRGGTGHVVEVALRNSIPVTAYHLDGKGNVVEYASVGASD